MLSPLFGKIGYIREKYSNLNYSYSPLLLFGDTYENYIVFIYKKYIDMYFWNLTLFINSSHKLLTLHLESSNRINNIVWLFLLLFMYVFSSLFIPVLFFARVSLNSNRWHTRSYANTANGRETARIVDLRLDYSHFCKMNKGRERELGIGWKEKERVPIVMINHIND